MSYRYQSPSGPPPPHSSFQHYPSSNAHTPSHSAFPNKYGGNHFQSNSNTGFGMGGVGVGVGGGGGGGGMGGVHRSVSGSHTIHDSHHSSSSGWDDSNGASGSSNSQGYEETHSNWENYGAGFTSPSQTTTQHHDSHSITSHHTHHPHPHPHPHSHSMETPSKSDKMERDGHNDRKLDPNMDLDFGLDLKKLGLDVDDEEERETASQRGGGDNNGEEDTVEEMTTGRTTQSQSSTKRRSKRRSAEEEKEPVINVLSLLYDPPVEGCILKPYVSITDSDGVTTALRANLSEDTVEDESDSPVEWRWYRGQKRICSVASCQGGANLQCLSCLKAKLPVHMAYFCSAKCWKDAWPVHRSLHARNSITPAIVTNSNGETSTSWDCDDADEYTVERPDSPTAISCKYPPPVSNIWAEVARSRSYTPVPEDVGRALRIECAPIIKRGIMVPASEVNEGHHVSNPHISINPAVLAVMNGQIQANLLGNWTRIDTSAVMVAPGPPLPRQVIYRHTNQATSGSPFKVVCFNVLAQIYATNQIYPYCAIWALNWDYRKKILLREICSHNADIICLQEVQANHFDSFFQPGLSKAGYDGIFKRKTRDAVGDMHPDSIDGCAIFYRRERFALMEQYGIEFNEAARQQTSDRKSLRRLLKGNIALVVVLEELTSGGAQPQQRRQRKRRLCVANTHIYWDPEYADVKLWQTWVLCQELEKLVLHRNLPLLLCGDFNSMVDSSVYELLSQERITNKRVYDSDPCGILPDLSELRHRLPLVSLYASIGEPKYTNFTGHFVGVLDYMFFTKTHMVSTSILDVDSESVLRDHTALPSPQFSSDHISLVGELDWLLDA